MICNIYLQQISHLIESHKQIPEKNATEKRDRQFLYDIYNRLSNSNSLQCSNINYWRKDLQLKISFYLYLSLLLFFLKFLPLFYLHILLSLIDNN